MINEREQMVKDWLEKKGFKVKKLDGIGKPDFIVNKEFYIEVKRSDSYLKTSNDLSSTQIETFKRLNLPIFILWINKFGKKVIEEFNEENYIGYKKEVQLNVTFEDEEFDTLKDLKSKFKNLKNWRDFLLLLESHCRESLKRGDLKPLK